MSDATTPAAPRPHRAWPLYLIAALMVVAIGISLYMSRHHEVELYGGEEYAAEELVGCAEAEGVSCDIVNTSEWSEVFGVPLFTWGIPTYLLVLVLSLAAARGGHKAKPMLVVIGVGATLFSVFLYYISIVELKYVCLWCMRLYGINAVILVGSALSGITRDDMPEGKNLGTAAALFAVFTLVAVGGQKAFRASLLEGTPEIAAIVEPPPEAVETVYAKDPVGPATPASYNVTTEDKNEALIHVVEDDMWKGNPAAKVSVVEFADFECGYCKRAGHQLKRLYETYKDDVVFIYKHFPMDPKCNPGVNNPKHRYACQAHEAAACAREQGYFWSYHDLLYKNQHQLRSEHLLTYARKVGMDPTVFVTCMQEGRGKAAVQADGEEGKALDIHGTPRIYINGQLYRSGASAEQMARTIELALGKDAKEAAQGAIAMRETNNAIKPIPADVPEMQRIRYGALDFEIDTFESAVTDGKAVSAKHEIPGTRMSWYAANDACTAAGKRVCSEQEWIAACQAAPPVDDDENGKWADDLIEGNSYPYGDFHLRGRCWEDKDRDTFRPVYTGEMPGCVTQDGVYDMAGNMEEWVGSTAEEAVLIGGAYDTPTDKARCYRRNDTFGAGYASKRTGFRCCR